MIKQSLSIVLVLVIAGAVGGSLFWYQQRVIADIELRSVNHSSPDAEPRPTPSDSDNDELPLPSDDGDSGNSDPLSRVFAETLQNKAREIKDTMPIEGYTADMLVDLFSGLENRHFDGVEAQQGVYRYDESADALTFEFTTDGMQHSAARTVSAAGYETLLATLRASYDTSLQSQSEIQLFVNTQLASAAPSDAVSISFVQPSEGPVGTEVVISGSGFTSANTVHFGSGGARNVSATADGSRLAYTIPGSVSPCDLVSSERPCGAPVEQVTSGGYQLWVGNENGESDKVTFTVTAR